MSLAFSMFDFVVVAVIIGSTAYATWRGFVDESLSIFAWAAAAFASLYFGGWAAELLRGVFSSYWIGTLAGYGAIFLVAFLPLSFVSHRLGEGVRSSLVGPLDRVLGATFGVVRGLAVLGLAYLVFTAFVPIRSQPTWLSHARTLPLIQTSSEVLLSLVPEHSRWEKEPAPNSREVQADPAASPRPRPKPGKDKKGYGVEDRRALDRLLQATGSGR